MITRETDLCELVIKSHVYFASIDSSLKVLNISDNFIEDQVAHLLSSFNHKCLVKLEIEDTGLPVQSLVRIFYI